MNETSTQLTANDIIFLYACGPVAVAGFLLCLLSTIIFSHREFKSQNLFVYFRFECAYMTLNLLIKILFTISNNNQFSVAPLFSAILYVYLNGYVSSVLETCVTLTNIFSSTCCLSAMTAGATNSLLNSTIKYVAGLNPYFVMIVSVLSAALLFVYSIFTIEYSPRNVTFVIEFFKANHTYFDSVAFTTRDIVLLLLLISLNVLIAVRIRRKFGKKMLVSKHNAERTKESTNRLTLMVLVDCINTIIGRLWIVLYYYVSSYAPQFITNTMPMMSSLAFLFVYLAYTLKFFIFYYFNKRFSEICVLELNLVIRRCSIFGALPQTTSTNANSNIQI